MATRTRDAYAVTKGLRRTRRRGWVAEQFGPPSRLSISKKPLIRIMAEDGKLKAHGERKWNELLALPTHREVAKFLSEKFFPGAADDTTFVTHAKKTIGRSIFLPSGLQATRTQENPTTLGTYVGGVRRMSVETIGEDGEKGTAVPITFVSQNGHPIANVNTRRKVRYEMQGMGSAKEKETAAMAKKTMFFEKYGRGGDGHGPGDSEKAILRFSPELLQTRQPNYTSASDTVKCRRVIFSAEANQRVYNLTKSSLLPPILFLIRKDNLDLSKLALGTTVLCSTTQFERNLGIGYNLWMAKSLGFNVRTGEHVSLLADKTGKLRELEKSGGSFWQRVGYTGKLEIIETEHLIKPERKFFGSVSRTVTLPDGTWQERVSGDQVQGVTVARIKPAKNSDLNRQFVRSRSWEYMRAMPWKGLYNRILKHFYPPAENLRWDSELANDETIELYAETNKEWANTTYKRFAQRTEWVAQGEPVKCLSLLRTLAPAALRQTVESARRMMFTPAYGDLDPVKNTIVVGQDIQGQEAMDFTKRGLMVISIGKEAVEHWGLRFLAECIQTRFKDCETEVVYPLPRGEKRFTSPESPSIGQPVKTSGPAVDAVGVTSEEKIIPEELHLAVEKLIGE